MPSMNRPSWRGVSTPREQSTVNYITEGLSQLERSTTLLRQNLSNYLAGDNPERIGEDNSNEISPVITNTVVIHEAIEAGYSTIETPDTETLTQAVDQILQQNETLKARVHEVLEANESFKEDMKNYLEDCAKWKQEFVDETRKIELDFQAVMVHRINPIQSQEPARDSNISNSNDISCGLKNKLITWYNVAEVYGKNTISNWKQRWNSLQLVEDIYPNMAYIGNNMYHANSYFDIGLTY